MTVGSILVGGVCFSAGEGRKGRQSVSPCGVVTSGSMSPVRQ